MATQVEAPRFRLLGDVEIGDGADLRGLKQRTLLAYLLLHAGEIVPTERLVDAVWWERPPPTATAIVHAYIRKLRAAFANAPVELLTRAPGYVLELDEDELDIRLFERLAQTGREALRAGEPDRARAQLAEALSLWRGEPMADLPGEGFIAEERARLDQLRSAVLADRIDADLDLGRSGELIAELEALVREQPFQERPRRQLMIALYRAGRQADALALYRETRRLFANELGIEPSRALQQLEQAMLRQDDSLEVPPAAGRAPPEPTTKPSWARAHVRWALASAVAAAVAAAVVVPLTVTSGGSLRPRVRPAKILASFDVAQPSCCGFGFGAAWSVGHHDDILRKIDPDSNRIVGRWRIAGYQSGVPRAAAGSVWIPSAAADLVRFDPTHLKVAARIPVSGPDVAFGYLTMWETTGEHQLDRINLKSNKVVRSLRLAPGANNWVDELAVGEGAIWVAVADDATLVRVDPLTNAIVARISGFGETDSGMPIAVDQNAVWVLRFIGGQEMLFRVDPSTNMVAQRIAVGAPNGAAPAGTVTTGGGYVWTANWDNTISKVDERTNRVVGVYRLPAAPQNVNYADGSLWVDAYDASKIWRIDPNG